MHSTCVECANIFGLHWELSHVAMVTDSLPALQLMCHSENLRETANTQRRYTMSSYARTTPCPFLQVPSFPLLWPHPSFCHLYSTVTARWAEQCY